MKYISIDIETTGLDENNNQVLSIGAVIEDTNNIKPITELPKFHAAIKRREIRGSLFAINMNKNLISNINHYIESDTVDEKNDLIHMTNMQFLDEDKIVEELYHFIFEYYLSEEEKYDIVSKTNFIGINKKGMMMPSINGNPPKIYINAAGKNFGTFDLKFLQLLPRWKQLLRVRHKIIDPATLCTDWKNDESLPSLPLCKKRIGFDSHISHNAVEDAIDVINILRSATNNYTNNL